MALTTGTRLGAYEVFALIGIGGMGEVYRARDTRLRREVAIKVLPDTFSQDPDRLARFQREAELLATLNHPNIAAVYGLEKADGVTGIVLELVEGPTLAELIERAQVSRLTAQGPDTPQRDGVTGPKPEALSHQRGRARTQGLPIDDALPIARQIADALEAAHERGVIHRDLKPANIKVTPAGQVKVLDFGLAKVAEPVGVGSGPPSLTNSPTLSMQATLAGVILGTAAYMSPEQAKGRPVDRRTDIFAFGCVLYEMLTGRPAFGGDDVTEILGRVVTAEPDWNRLPAGTPPSIRRLLRRALKKDPRQRLGDIRDGRIEIEEAGTEAASEQEESVASASAQGGRLAWVTSLAAAAVMIVALAIPAVRHLWETPPLSSPELRLQIITPATSASVAFALSPDGGHIVFVASGGGPQRLWLRPLNKTDAQPMAGTDGADYPFWSADGRSIGFFASNKLFRIDIFGGPPQILANALLGLGGTWNADGTILFAPGPSSPLSRIAAAGGEPVAATRLDVPGQSSHRSPQFLPDGRHFLFYAAGSPGVSGIYLGALDGGEPKRLTAADTAGGAYLKPDVLVFLRQGALVARRLDVARGELTGEEVTLVDPVGDSGAVTVRAFSVAADGRVAYRTGGAGSRQLTWFDRSGKAVGAAGNPDANIVFPELSPDGRRVAVQNNGDVWLMNVERGGITRFTFDAALDLGPVWSPDGKRIAFLSTRKGTGSLYVKPSSGTGMEESLFETPNTKWTQDWSQDGRLLLYYEIDPKTAVPDLWALEATGTERKPRVVVNTPFDERSGQFSPDGRWVAYQTNESGRFEIVVQPFPDPSGKWQVSTSGGNQPRWRADGKELYFIAPDGSLMAVPVTALGSTFEAGSPVALFPTRILGGGLSTFPKPQYAVSRDGRFLINQAADESTTTPITLILNWQPPQNQ